MGFYHQTLSLFDPCKFRPVCSCPNGFEGNPYDTCVKVTKMVVESENNALLVKAVNGVFKNCKKSTKVDAPKMVIVGD